MESRGSYRLTLRQGPVPGKVYELVKDVVTIGRDVSNDIVINDAEVSRNHARLTEQSGGYLLEDLASTNGSFVNGQRLIGPKLLNAGDVVGLGETVVLEYTAIVADAGATVIAAAPMRPIEQATIAPRAPEPVFAPPPVEPEPPPTVAEPMFAPPPPAPMAAPAPMSAPSAPLPQKRDNRMMYYIGGCCGCLTLCACLAAVAYYAYNAGLFKQFLP